MRPGKRVWDWLRSFPPIMVRLAARRKIRERTVVAVSQEEIAIESGIPLWRVIEISHEFDWDGVTVGEAERFCAACNFDPTNAEHRNNQRRYVRLCQKRNRPAQYLRQSPLWDREFAPLIRLLRSHPESIAKSVPPASARTVSAA